MTSPEYALPDNLSVGSRPDRRLISDSPEMVLLPDPALIRPIYDIKPGSQLTYRRGEGYFHIRFKEELGVSELVQSTGPRVSLIYSEDYRYGVPGEALLLGMSLRHDGTDVIPFIPRDMVDASMVDASFVFETTGPEGQPELQLLKSQI